MNPILRVLGAPLKGVAMGLTWLVLIQINLFSAFAGVKKRHAVMWVAMFLTVVSQAWVARALWHGQYFDACVRAIGVAIVMWIAQAWEEAADKGNWIWPLGWKIGEGKFRSMVLSTMPAVGAHAVKTGGQRASLPGTTTSGEKVVRGNRIISANSFAGLSTQMMSKPELATAIRLGGIPIPRSLEVLGMFMFGAPGSGKSNAISTALVPIRLRNEPVMIADSKSGFLERFYRAGHDYILNPFDLRDIKWNPFNEIRTPYDYAKIAKSAIPDGKAGASSATWNQFAQTVFTSIFEKLHKDGNHSIRELRRLMFQAQREELAEFLSGTDAEIIAGEGGDRALHSMRVTALPYMEGWKYLQEDGDFSVVDWVNSVDAGNDRWLFMPYSPSQKPILKYLISTWMDLALGAAMNLPENENRRHWYVMDELDSLGKLNTLVEASTNLRKHGGCLLLGTQAPSQLDETYGEKNASSVRDAVPTKVIFRAGGDTAAKVCTSMLGGKVEVLRASSSEGRNRHNQDFTSSSNTTTNTATTPADLFLTSDITGLKNNTGYLMLASWEEVTKVSLEYLVLPKIAAAFEPNYDQANIANPNTATEEVTE